MITQQLIDYIKQEQQMGKSQQEITQALLSQGWKEADINEGFSHASSGAPAPMPMGQTSENLPKAKQIFQESWSIYKTYFKTLFTINIIPTLIAWVVTFFLIGGGIAGTSLRLEQTTKIALGAAGIVVGIAALIFVIYINVWAAVAMLFAIKDKDENIHWKEAFKRSRFKINPFFSTAILACLAIFGGALLLVIPGIIFALWFSQSSYVVIEENLQNSAALTRSKYYVKGRLWELFCKFFYIGIISMLIYFIVGFIGGIASNGDKNSPIPGILSGITSLFWTPLTLVYGYQLYKYLKKSRP